VTNWKIDKDVQVLIIGGIFLLVLAYLWLQSGQKLQILLLGGTIIIILATIWAFGGKKISMKSHHKIQVVGLLGLTSVAIIALILAILYHQEEKITTAIIAIASTAVGGIAGFLTHKTTLPNRTVLLPISDQTIIAGNELKFNVNGQSSANYNLKYTMTSTPALPDTAKLNELSGEFKFTPPADAEANTYNVIFTVTDGQGTSDSRSVKIIVVPKPNQGPSK
jgi:hypothetical protein